MAIPIEPQGRALKVLVVDDTATNRLIVQVFLKKLGHQVVMAEDGAQAVDKFQSENPDLVLMDVMMPVMDGYEATRRIKALSSDHWVPVIFLSALDKEENLVAGLDAGGDDYLAKPVNFVVLQAKLRSFGRAIEAHGRLTEARRWLQTVSDTIVDAIVTADAQGIIRSVNPSAEHIFGFEPGELIGQKVNVLMAEPYRSEHDGYMRRYLGGGMPHVIGDPNRHVVEGMRKDGMAFPVDISLGEARVGEERIFIAVLRDVSQRVADERRLQETLRQLQTYHDQQESENTLSAEILLRQLKRGSLDDDTISCWLSPAAWASGDVVAAARAPSGELYAMLADATGHGLAASISTLPLITLFYEMVEWGMALSAIVARINGQLRQSLPASRFVAAALLMIDEKNRQAEIWVGGVPAVLLLAPDGTVTRTFAPTRVPLGVVDFDNELSAVDRFTYAEGSQLLLSTDGLSEAENAAGESFGEERIRAAVAGMPAGGRRAALQAALAAHLDGRLPHDDITLLLVDCR